MSTVRKARSIVRNVRSIVRNTQGIVRNAHGMVRKAHCICAIWFPGGVWSQGWNLKELTEGHHQEWSLRLNLIQHGETYQVPT